MKFLKVLFAKNYNVSIIMGKTGSGKSTYLVKKLRRKLKKGYPIYTNYPLKGAYKIDVSDLGNLNIEEKAIIAIDEASIDINSRNYKNLKKELHSYLVLHRHYKHTLYFLAQDKGMIDLNIRRLAHHVFITKKILKLFVISFKCESTWEKNEYTNDIELSYKIRKLPCNVTYIPRYISYFDSFKVDKFKKDIEKTSW